VQLLKLSTAAIVPVGPILDLSGAAYTGAVIGDLNIWKNGTTAAMAAAATLTHDHNGYYSLALTTGNTDTLGRLDITCNKSTYAMSQKSFEVLPATTFDAIVTNAAGAAGGMLYNGANTGAVLPRVTLVDTITTYTGDTPQTGDSFARIGATGSGLTSLAPASTALSTAQWTNARAAMLDALSLRTGTAQAGAAGTITLDAGASATNDLYKGQWVVITSGTGAGQSRLITAYVGSTKVATVHRNWATNPDNTSVFYLLSAADIYGIVLADTTTTNTDMITAAGIRSAVGLASANLDTQLSTIAGYIDTEVGTTLSNTTSILAAVDTEVQLILDRLGAFTGTGTNTVLGFLRAALRSDLAAPSDVGGTYDPATDSQQAIRDRGDVAWITATGFSTHTAADVWAVATRTLTANTNLGFPSNFSAFSIDAFGRVDVGSVRGTALGASAGSNFNVFFHSGGFSNSAWTLSALIGYVDSIPADVRTELATELGRIDVATSTRASQTSVDTIDDYIDTEIGTILTNVATILAAVDTEIAAIQAKTDLLNADVATWATRGLTMIELDGAVYRYTINALEQAPSGGGGGSDPLLNAVPGAYVAGSAGYNLGLLPGIYTKTQLIGTVTGGLLWADDAAEDLAEVTIFPGDAYYVAEGRGFSVSVVGGPTLTGGTVKWVCTYAGGLIQTSGNGTITGTGTTLDPYVVTAGDLTEAETAKLDDPNVEEGRLVVILSNTHNITVKRYKVTVVKEAQPS
jgi:hypothetical protein